MELWHTWIMDGDIRMKMFILLKIFEWVLGGFSSMTFRILDLILE